MQAPRHRLFSSYTRHSPDYLKQAASSTRRAYLQLNQARQYQGTKMRPAQCTGRIRSN